MNRNIISISFCLLTTLITTGLTAQDPEDPGMQLHYAVVSGNIEQVESLISGGIDINTNNQLNWTPLHTAVRNNRIEIVRFLLENGANLDAVDARGQTALHFAVESGQKEVVELLIEKGANLDVYDERRESVISLARKAGQAEIAEILIEHGAIEQRGRQRTNSNRGRSLDQGVRPPIDDYTDYNQVQIIPRPGITRTGTRPNTQVDILSAEDSQIMELPSDPNEIQARIRSFDGLEESIIDISGKSRAEMRQWRNTEDDNRVALFRAVQRQLEFELDFTKQTATEENAKRTTEAVDTLINTKDDRSRIIIREITVQIREQERELRATTGRTRGSARATRGRAVQDADLTEQTGRTMPMEEEETDRYDPNTQAELDLWLAANVMEFDNTISFAETLNEQIREEFRPIRQIASEENAAKTMAAIDGILLARQERLTELAEQLETARARAEETDETRSTRGRGRMDQGMTDQDTGGRRRR